jgi:hypothetical protein
MEIWLNCVIIQFFTRISPDSRYFEIDQILIYLRPEVFSWLSEPDDKSRNSCGVSFKSNYSTQLNSECALTILSNLISAHNYWLGHRSAFIQFLDYRHFCVARSFKFPSESSGTTPQLHRCTDFWVFQEGNHMRIWKQNRHTFWRKHYLNVVLIAVALGFFLCCCFYVSCRSYDGSAHAKLSRHCLRSREAYFNLRACIRSGIGCSPCRTSSNCRFSASHEPECFARPEAQGSFVDKRNRVIRNRNWVNVLECFIDFFLQNWLSVYLIVMEMTLSRPKRHKSTWANHVSIPCPDHDADLPAIANQIRW